MKGFNFEWFDAFIGFMYNVIFDITIGFYPVWLYHKYLAINSVNVKGSM